MNSEKVNYSSGAVLRKVLILVLAAEAAIAEAILLIFDRLIPAPLAEYMAFSYAYERAGKVALCGLILTLFGMALALCVLTASRRYRNHPLFKIPAAALVAADLVVHSYVFLAADGYGWNYLASAALDALLLVCILYKPHDVRAEADDTVEEKI